MIRRIVVIIFIISSITGCKEFSSSTPKSEPINKNESNSNQIRNIIDNLDLQYNIEEAKINQETLIIDLKRKTLKLNKFSTPFLIYYIPDNNCISCYRGILEKLQTDEFKSLRNKCIVICHFKSFRDYQVLVNSFPEKKVPIFFLKNTESIFVSEKTDSVIEFPTFFITNGNYNISHICSLTNALPSYISNYLNIIQKSFSAN